MSSTPLSETTPSSPRTSCRSSMTDKPAISPSHPPTRHQFSMSLTPPLHPSKNSRPLPCSEYASPQKGWRTSPLYPLGQLRPSSTWRTTTSPTLRGPSPTASSQPSTTAAQPPTNAWRSPDDISTNSKERCMQGRQKSAASVTVTPPPTCLPASSATGDEWTSRCPPTEGRTSSPDGSDSWVTGRSSPEPASEPTSQNTWSRYTSHQTTQHAPPPYSPPGSSSSSKQTRGPTTPWLKRHVASTTPQLSQKWSDTATTTHTEPSSKWHDAPSSPTSRKKTTRFRGLNIVWKRTGSTNASQPSKGRWTSAKSSPAATTSSPAAPTLVDTAGVDQGVLPKEGVILPPEQVAELLPWYMQWSRDLAAEMHQRRLVRDKARRTVTLPPA